MLREEELNNIKSYNALCELAYCEINNIQLDYKDFGNKHDTKSCKSSPYCCRNMQFIPYKQVKQKTLQKYNITEDEYRKIQEKLGCLSFGCCDWCS